MYTLRPLMMHSLVLHRGIVRMRLVFAFSSILRSILVGQLAAELFNWKGRGHTSAVSACLASFFGNTATAQCCKTGTQATLTSTAAAVLWWGALLVALSLWWVSHLKAWESVALSQIYSIGFVYILGAVVGSNHLVEGAVHHSVPEVKSDLEQCEMITLIPASGDEPVPPQREVDGAQEPRDGRKAGGLPGP